MVVPKEGEFITYLMYDKICCFRFIRLGRKILINAGYLHHTS